jgi:hypothetical protein
LFTTVYVVPFITAVSPTLAPAHLQVPLLSKEIEDDAVLDAIETIIDPSKEEEAVPVELTALTV